MADPTATEYMQSLMQTVTQQREGALNEAAQAKTQSLMLGIQLTAREATIAQHVQTIATLTAQLAAALGGVASVVEEVVQAVHPALETPSTTG